MNFSKTATIGIWGLSLLLTGTAAAESVTPNTLWQQEDHQDFYLTIYNNLDELQDLRARTALSKQTGISVSELQDILHNQIFPDSMHNQCRPMLQLADSGDNTALSFEELTQCRDLLHSAYLIEKDLAQLYLQMEHDLLPASIWLNASLQDSKFDLITDLNIIDQLLFGDKADNISPPFQSQTSAQSSQIATTDFAPKKRLLAASTVPASAYRLAPEETCQPVDALEFKKIYESDTENQNLTEAKKEQSFRNQINNNPIGGSYSDLPADSQVFILSETQETLLTTALQKLNGQNISDPNSLVNVLETVLSRQELEELGVIPLSAVVNLLDDFEIKLESDDPNPILAFGETQKGSATMFGGLFEAPEKNWCLGFKQDLSQHGGFDLSMCVEFELNVFDSQTAPSGGGSGSKNNQNSTANCVDCHIIKMNELLRKLLGYNVLPEKNTKHSWELSHRFNLKPDFAFSGLNFNIFTKPVWKPAEDPFVNTEDNKTMEAGAKGESPDQTQKEWSIRIEHEKFLGIIAQNRGQFGAFNELSYDADMDEKTLQKSPAGTSLENAFEKIQQNTAAIDQELANLLEIYYWSMSAEDAQRYWTAVQLEIEKLNGYLASFQEQYTYLGSEEGNGLSKKLLENSSRECTTL